MIGRTVDTSNSFASSFQSFGDPEVAPNGIEFYFGVEDLSRGSVPPFLEDFFQSAPPELGVEGIESLACPWRKDSSSIIDHARPSLDSCWDPFRISVDPFFSVVSHQMMQRGMN